MHAWIAASFALLTPLISATAIPKSAQQQIVLDQHGLSDSSDVSTKDIPTVRESAVMARRIMRLENIGTLSTVFPNRTSSSSLSTTEDRPSTAAGMPLGLMDYFADCEPESGNPTILAMTIASSFKNEAAGSNITLSLRWHPNFKHQYSAASLPRFALIGYLERISEEDVQSQKVRECFVRYHPDAFYWTPGNPIHESYWVRFVVQDIYWLGGFGNVAYIGWIPLEEWQSVTQEEIEDYRLPGERTSFWSRWF